MGVCPFPYPTMALRSDDLLDQLDSRLSMMQAQLPSNPDTRRLPSGWVEHLDPQYVLSSSSSDVVLTNVCGGRVAFSRKLW